MQELKAKILKAINDTPEKRLEWNDLIPLLDRNEDRIILDTLRSMEAEGTAFRVLETKANSPESILSIRLTKPPLAGSENPPVTPTPPTLGGNS